MFAGLKHSSFSGSKSLILKGKVMQHLISTGKFKINSVKKVVCSANKVGDFFFLLNAYLISLIYQLEVFLSL